MSEDRGVSEVLGYILVFTLIVASITVVSVGGFGSLRDARDAEQVENAQRAFDVLSNNMADVYYRGAPSRATEFAVGDSTVSLGDPVVINVSVRDGSGIHGPDPYETRPLVQDLAGGRQLVYSAGAVLGSNRQSGLIVHDPPFLVGTSRVHLTVPVFRSPAVKSVSGETVLVRGKVNDRSVPVRDTDGSYNTVFVNVTSPRDDAWSQYLESEGFTCQAVASAPANTIRCGRSAPATVYFSVQTIRISLV
jgi:hypothetical protein